MAAAVSVQTPASVAMAPLKGCKFLLIRAAGSLQRLVLPALAIEQRALAPRELLAPDVLVRVLRAVVVVLVRACIPAEA